MVRLPGGHPTGLSRNALREHTRNGGAGPANGVGSHANGVLERAGLQRYPSVESIGFTPATPSQQSGSMRHPPSGPPTMPTTGGASLANRQSVSPASPGSPLQREPDQGNLAIGALCSSRTQRVCIGHHQCRAVTAHASQTADIAARCL